MKMYFIFALICFQDPEVHTGMNCLNFWEENKPTYKAAKCHARAEEVGDEIVAKLKQDDIKIMEHIIWCVNAKGEVI
mgnify:FL=1